MPLSLLSMYSSDHNTYNTSYRPSICVHTWNVSGSKHHTSCWGLNDGGRRQGRQEGGLWTGWTAKVSENSQRSTLRKKWKPRNKWREGKSWERGNSSHCDCKRERAFFPFRQTKTSPVVYGLEKMPSASTLLRRDDSSRESCGWREVWKRSPKE